MPSLRGAVSRLRRGTHRLLSHRGVAPETLVYECNICSARCALPISLLDREAGACASCGSVMRHRAVVQVLSQALFGRPLAIAEFPSEKRRLRGLGMSDNHMLAAHLGKQLDYTNTYFHQEPRVDVCAPAPEHLRAYDFVTSSDVMEHVAPPVERGFAGLRSLLKPGGILVLTVPFMMDGDTVEHFPDLHDYALEDRQGRKVLVNRTRDGRRQEFPDPVFHGGDGATLEMRHFSEAGLRLALERTGFRDITFHRQPCFRFGIFWAHPWSVPVSARPA